MKAHVLILRKSDIDTIKENIRNLESSSDQELIDLYNREAKMGLVGVNAQAIHLCALGHLFHKRFGESPVKVEDNVITINGKASLIDGKLEIH